MVPWRVPTSTKTAMYHFWVTKRWHHSGRIPNSPHCVALCSLIFEKLSIETFSCLRVVGIFCFNLRALAFIVNSAVFSTGLGQRWSLMGEDVDARHGVCGAGTSFRPDSGPQPQHFTGATLRHRYSVFDSKGYHKFSQRAWYRSSLSLCLTVSLVFMKLVYYE